LGEEVITSLPTKPSVYRLTFVDYLTDQLAPKQTSGSGTSMASLVLARAEALSTPLASSAW
jgi:hypothetical protein